ncbi:hypothetical protein IJJ27_02150 [bacterium]|nr:hypothetical protein [bacterium]
MARRSIDVLRHHGWQLGDPEFDTVFILVHCERAAAGEYRFVVDNDTPVVRLNGRIPGYEPTVKSIATSQQYSLLSANAVVSIRRYGYPVILRDPHAPVYPLHYTCPAGRCETAPRATALAELNQEIQVHLKSLWENEAQLGFGNPSIAREGSTYKQLRLKRQSLHILTQAVDWTTGPDRYELVYRSCFGDQVIERGSATIVFDADTNCYEVCFIGKVDLPNNWVVTKLEDGDGWGRPVEFVKHLEDLKGRQLVPALQGLVDSLS